MVYCGTDLLLYETVVLNGVILHLPASLVAVISIRQLYCNKCSLSRPYKGSGTSVYKDRYLKDGQIWKEAVDKHTERQSILLARNNVVNVTNMYILRLPVKVELVFLKAHLMPR